MNRARRSRSSSWPRARRVGCGLNQEGVPPPANTFFYPASAVTDQAGRWLFVANSNADLRYNDGTLVTVDLDAVAKDRLPGDTAGQADFVAWGPCPSADYVNTPRAASDAAALLLLGPAGSEHPQLRRAGLHPGGRHRPNRELRGRDGDAEREPPFMVRRDGMPLHTRAEAHRLFVAVRGDTSVTWIDLAPGGTPPDIDPYAIASQPQLR